MKPCVDHDVRPGHLDRCQICGSDDLRLIIDLGHQPLCDALLTAEQLNEPEVTYPLRLMQCNECSLAQLDYVVAGAVVYPHDYPYRAGISWPVVAAHKEMAARIVARFAPRFVVDIGSNDGTLLAQFQKVGVGRVLGIEPTGIGELATVPTLPAFFTEALARGIVADDRQQADVITMTNVFAHMAELGEVMRGVAALLDRYGVLVIENHYLLDILQGNQFDSIYHEHVRTYTLKSLITLFEQYGMEVFQVERVPRYGGNIRAYVGWSHVHGISKSVGELLKEERDAGVESVREWDQFRARVIGARDGFNECLYAFDCRGCSAPGRASTLLNFYGARHYTLPFTGEIDGSLKIGKYLPGCHIPVFSNKYLVEEQPEAILLLAWHYAKEIAERLRREGVRSKLFVPLPTFKELSQ